jgi:hypothetical protein
MRLVPGTFNLATWVSPVSLAPPHHVADSVLELSDEADGTHDDPEAHLHDGTAGSSSPRHRTHIAPSFLDLNGIQ